MSSAILNMQDSMSPDTTRRKPLGALSNLGGLPAVKSNSLAPISSTPWNKTIWGDGALSFAPSSKHLQVDTTNAAKFQKTGSGLLVDSSTTDDWSGGIKNLESAEVSRPSTQHGRPSKVDSASNAPRGPAISLNGPEDSTRPSFVAGFSNMRTSARPGSSSGYTQPESSTWPDAQYSHSPIDERPYTSAGSAHSIPSSLPASHHSDEMAMDMFANSNRISPDSARLMSSSLSSRHGNVPPQDPQLAMQFGQMSINNGLDSGYQSQPSKSPHTFPSAMTPLTRHKTFPEPHGGHYPGDQYTENEVLSSHSQVFSPYGANFYPGMPNHQGMAEYGFTEMHDARPTSSSSSLCRDARRDSAHGREVQMYSGPRPSASDFQSQARLRQQPPQGFRSMAPDPRSPPYYSAMGMPRISCNAMSYQAALATYGQMPPTAMMSPNFMQEVHSSYDPGQAYRSVLLNEYKANAKSCKRLELKDIYDHVVEFSGDQHGSRFIQSKLEGASSDEKQRVFQEIEPNAIQLMTDVFGNYVIQKLFEHGDQTQKRLLADKMKGQVMVLSTQMYGCRVVQKALQHILNDQQTAIIRELDQAQDILRCVKDQNGNHVIQRAIERCQPATTSYILDAFANQIMHLSNHAYGCRVIQRCLEYCGPKDKAAIMNELRGGIASLVSDQFGNYVVQHVVEHGSDDDRACVLEIVKRDLGNYSKHKFASNVVEKCLQSAGPTWRNEIVQKLTETGRGEVDSMLLDLIKDSYGNYVIQKLLDVMNHQDFAAFLVHLQPELVKAKRVGQGKQVQSIERKMQRFEKAPREASAYNDYADMNYDSPASHTPTAQNNLLCSMSENTMAGAMQYGRHVELQTGY